MAGSGLHSCQSGAWWAILLDAFPSERRKINDMANEASFSRVVGGLHYTFDGDAGLALGRKGRKARAQARDPLMNDGESGGGTPPPGSPPAPHRAPNVRYIF